MWSLRSIIKSIQHKVTITTINNIPDIVKHYHIYNIIMSSSSSSVNHCFIWKWNTSYSDEDKVKVLSHLRALSSDNDNCKVSCGENIINNLNLPGCGSNPKDGMSQGFDCGLHCIAKDEEAFRQWWSSDEHKEFMEKYPDFASIKINLQWMQ